MWLVAVTTSAIFVFIMKTLTFPQFLDMMDKTHCTYYHIAKNKDGFYIAYLGFVLDDSSFFAVYKSRPFKLPLKNTELVVTANAVGLILHPYPRNVVFI